MVMVRVCCFACFALTRADVCCQLSANACQPVYCSVLSLHIPSLLQWAGGAVQLLPAVDARVGVPQAESAQGAAGVQGGHTVPAGEFAVLNNILMRPEAAQ